MAVNVERCKAFLKYFNDTGKILSSGAFTADWQYNSKVYSMKSDSMLLTENMKPNQRSSN